MKVRILVVEDEQEVRELLTEILTSEDHEVEASPNGSKALQMFKNNYFDLVFTDLGMPGMTGWQVAEEIKRINCTTPVSVITGWSVNIDDSELKARGVDFIVPEFCTQLSLTEDMLQKPLLLLVPKKVKNFDILTSQVTRSNPGHGHHLILSRLHDTPAKPLK